MQLFGLAHIAGGGIEVACYDLRVLSVCNAFYNPLLRDESCYSRSTRDYHSTVIRNLFSQQLLDSHTVLW
jgi:hypothetical protein